ncbi:endonuclease/exonuclease/phosphatase family protein [Microbacterium sp. GCS4]|uniref:endonuclease/exonuclease/phosphatase family protein n=1 Tax=Microbacterium sp. GCS4 TaxID=1692239 RepID=UPI000681E040|nr:endonuclease/exonuclease/phosphatase family protein [Microbacterium sp. GCS4]
MSSSPAPGTRRRRRSALLTAVVAVGALIASPLLLAAPASAAVPSQITLASAEVGVGDALTVDFATDRPSTKNWVAIYPASKPEPCDACGMAWAYAPGTSGTIQLPTKDRGGNDLPAGSYRVEYLYNDGYTRVSEPATFTIAGQPYEGSEVDPTKPISLSVMQLNLWGKSTDAVMLDEIGADLIFVEEAQNGAAALARDLGFDVHSTGGSAAVISRYPIVDAGVVTVAGTQGGWMKAIVQVGDTQIAAYGGHLEYRYYATYLPRGYAGDVLAPGFPAEWRGWNKLSAPVTDVEQILAANDASGRPASASALAADMAVERAAGRLTMMGADMNEPSALDWTPETADLYDHNGVVAPWQTTAILRDAGLVDAYRAKYPDPVTHPGFTWPADTPNVSVSQLAWAPEADERDRIDYIFFAPDDRLALESTRIVGPKGDIVRGARALPVSDEEIFTPQTLWTSDHKGLQAEFVVCGEACQAAAEPGDLVVGTPSVTGTAEVGATVTANPGAWTEGTAFAFQWLIDGEPVEGATSSTFTIPANTEAQRLSVRVRGSLDGYAPAEATSAPVTVAAAGEEPGAEEPTVAIGAQSVVAGGTLKVSGSGFAAGTALRIELHSTPVALGSVTTSAAGEFATTVTIPAAIPAGAHTLVVILPDGTQLRSAVTVTAAQGGASTGELAQTGGVLFGAALWAALAALVAGGILMIRRRAQQQ